ncbi:glycosyltransferase [Flavihumibacter profundi]|uniref:glycosyltransferase n=1 Tax=Flavihumibacter profundi TaxID=2716883 RepID=UPI001CC657B4|nr:glycosyltransferase [Flavihumibacter profundi]MBZ5857866.1 glycosyltransferase [Flavihumibacter profundi]
MNTLAYNIDPLLDEHAHFGAQSFLNAIPDLAESLSGFRHIAVTTATGVKLEPASVEFTSESIENQSIDSGSEKNTQLELVSLKIPGALFQSRKSVYKNVLKKWLRTAEINAWVTTDPQTIWEGLEVPAILMASAQQLLQPGGKTNKQRSGRDMPGWTAAKKILVPLQVDKTAILKDYPELENKISVVYPAFQEPVLPITWAEQEQVKMRYSGGRDYFLYAGELDESQDILFLLKAYSLVKKWLMTGMPLILAGPSTEWTPTLEKLLLTYKYRSDVSIFPNLEIKDVKELVAGAYVMVYPAASTEDAYPLEWAFSAGTPVITCDSEAIKELTTGASMLSTARDIDQLAHAMMLLYKDENRRAGLISAGKERVEKLNREYTIEQYKSVIQDLFG